MPRENTIAARLRCAFKITDVIRPVRSLAQAGSEYVSGRMLKRRPFVQANLLRKFSVAVEQTLIVLSGPCSRATEIDERALRNR